MRAAAPRPVCRRAQPQESFKDRPEFGDDVLFFSPRPPVAEKRETGGRTAVVDVPVVST